MTLVEMLSKQNFTLSLSSGFFGFFAHCGFVKAVVSEGLQPKLLTGSSAGAIVAACLTSGMTPEEMQKEFINLNKHHYWDPGFGVGFLKGQTFEKTLNDFVKPEMSDTKIPLQIATFDILKRQTEIFKKGPLPKIVRASCAVPMMFHPVKINGRFYWDGGIQDKMGWSNLDSSELILGHNLPNDPVSQFLEKKTSLNPKRILHTPIGIPSTSPGHFGNAPKAIAMAYEQAKIFLNSDV